MEIFEIFYVPQISLTFAENLTDLFLICVFLRNLRGNYRLFTFL